MEIAWLYSKTVGNVLLHKKTSSDPLIGEVACTRTPLPGRPVNLRFAWHCATQRCLKAGHLDETGRARRQKSDRLDGSYQDHPQHWNAERQDGSGPDPQIRS